MSDYGGEISDGDYDSDYDWLYIEDHYDEVDHLAEHTCPSPTLESFGTGYAEYDPYDYWQDITYLSDSFDESAGSIRKRRKSGKHELRLQKRLRRDASGSNASLEPSVVWKSELEREQALANIPYVKPEELETVSLLKDWRDRFKDISGMELIVNPNAAKFEGAHTAEGVDTSDLRSVAELLSGDSIDALKSMLKEKGLDPDALDVVLQDLLAGREPDFPTEEEGYSSGNSDESSSEQVRRHHSRTTTSSSKSVVPSSKRSGPTLQHSPSSAANGSKLTKKRARAESEIDANKSLSPIAKRVTNFHNFGESVLGNKSTQRKGIIGEIVDPAIKNSSPRKRKHSEPDEGVDGFVGVERKGATEVNRADDNQVRCVTRSGKARKL